MRKLSRQFSQYPIDTEFDIRFRRADSEQIGSGHCLSISGGNTLIFVAGEEFVEGLALEVQILANATIAPAMTAFVEVIRCFKQSETVYKITAAIKIIKAV